MPDWKLGTGYPADDAPIDEWEQEFLMRGPDRLKGHPHFKLTNDKVEFFTGPSIIQIERDGSLLGGPDPGRSSVTHMVIQFRLDQDIGAQLDRAKVWLKVNQQHRFSEPTNRKRVPVYLRYLRTLDAVAEQVAHSAIAAVLHPQTPDVYPTHRGRRRVGKDLDAARELARWGLRRRWEPK